MGTLDRFRRFFFLILVSLTATVFALALLTAPVQAYGEPSYVEWQTGPVLDQGITPECVGYSLAGLLQASPYAYNGSNSPSPGWIYFGGQARDAWHNKPHDGTSIEAGFQYLQEYGYIDSVQYTHDPAVVADYILNYGPVEMSTFWSTSMDSPDATGVITPNAFLRGFHAFYCYAYDRIKQMFGCQNSWGTEFAQAGRFKLSFDTMVVLLENDYGPGNREAAMPIKNAAKWLLRQLSTN